MRAAVISELGKLPELADRPEPVGGTVYQIRTVSLNPLDVNVGAGRYFGGHPELPYIPGTEGVGEDADGRRVYLFGGGLGLATDGLLAERVAVPANIAIPVPDAVADEIAASCGIAGLAGWMPVAWRAPVRSDDRVLVLGATGTAGLVAVQAAKLLGAKHVVAAGRNPERLERARALGADATVSLEEADLVTAFREASGGSGPTYVVDMVWGAPAAAATQAAAPNWRLVQVGQSAGPEATLTSAAVRGKMAEVDGFTVFAVPAEVFREHYLRLAGHASAGEIVLDIETFPLERVAEAWEQLARGAHRKLVVTLAPA